MQLKNYWHVSIDVERKAMLNSAAEDGTQSGTGAVHHLEMVYNQIISLEFRNSHHVKDGRIRLYFT